MAAAAAETRFVCGFIESAEMMVVADVPVAAGSADRTRRRRCDRLGHLATVIVDLLDRVESLRAAAPRLALGRMMELLFVEMLRRHASRLPPGSKGIVGSA